MSFYERLQWLRWKIAWWRWYLAMPYRLGDPVLGKGDVWRMNQDILRARWREREPKWTPLG